MMSKGTRPRVVVICGPTGIGKTGVGVILANEFGGEIISADSMQIYRRMNIGTAKPTAEELRAARHHLVDIRDPDQDFDAAEFVQAARAVADRVIEDGRLPIIVGGTGLYIKAFLQGLFETDAVDPAVRARLRAQTDGLDSEALHALLAAADAEAAARLHPNDRFRILRALETIESSGKSISEFHAGHQFKDEPYAALKIGLQMDREALYQRIDMRVDAMLADGLESEVRRLLDEGYRADLKSMQSIGYRHMVDFIQGRLTREECIRTLKRDTRRYAKRQFTWFGADTDIFWCSPDDLDRMRAKISQFLTE